MFGKYHSVANLMLLSGDQLIIDKADINSAHDDIYPHMNIPAYLLAA